MAVCNTCDNPATHSWQRHATQAEVEEFSTDPDNPSVQEHETTAVVPVYGCDEHALNDQLATLVHDAECTAPPTCDCTVSTLP